MYFIREVRFWRRFILPYFSGSKDCNTYVRIQFLFKTQVKSTVEFEKEGYILKAQYH